MKNQIFAFLFLIAFNINAQPPIQWKRCYGGTMNEFSNCIQQTTDRGYIICGYATSNNGDVTGNHGGWDYWLVKIDSLGGIIWQRSYGGTNGEEATFVQQTSNKGYIVSGYSGSNNGDVTGHHGLTNSSDYWILKIDSIGAVEWQVSLGGTSADWASSVRETMDGGYIVAGHTLSSDGDVTSNHGNVDYWIVKLNSSGVLQWQKTYGGSAYEEANSIQQTTDGGYIVAGYTKSVNGDVVGNHGNNDYWILKIDSLGTLQWQKSLGGSGYDEAYSIQQTNDRGYIVSGWTNSLDGNLIGHSATTGFDYWIVKLDTLGVIQWQKTYGGTVNERAHSIKQCTDNGYIVAGWSASADGDVTGHHGTIYQYDYWVLRLDSSGVKQWQKSLGGSAYDRPTSIQQTNDGGYIVNGYTQSLDGDVVGIHGIDYDFWVIKLYGTIVPLPVELLSFNATMNSKKTVEINWRTASEINNDYFTIERSSDAMNFELLKTVEGAGNSTEILEYYSIDEKPLPGISYYRLKQTDFDGSYKYSEIISVRNSKANFSIYPNPSDGNKINISVSGNGSEEQVILIYDINGRKVFSKNILITDKENTFVLFPENKLAQGVYMIQVKNDFEIEQQSLIVK